MGREGIIGPSEEPMLTPSFCLQIILLNENAVLVHVSRTSFLSERLLRFVLIVWSLHIRVSITLIVFLMRTLVNNDSTSKDIFIPIHQQAGLTG